LNVCILRVAQPLKLHTCINTADLCNAGRVVPASSSIMTKLWYCDTTATVSHYYRTRTLACRIYKPSSLSRYKKTLIWAATFQTKWYSEIWLGRV